jgi:hypothetical protein
VALVVPCSVTYGLMTFVRFVCVVMKIPSLDLQK